MTKPTKMITSATSKATKLAPKWSPRNKKKGEELSIENPSNGKSYLSIQKLLICYQTINSLITIKPLTSLNRFIIFTSQVSGLLTLWKKE